MIHRIETDKDSNMNPLFLEPGSAGSGVFTPGDSPKTVFLSPELQPLHKEGMLLSDLSYVTDRQLPDNFGHEAVKAARGRALEIVGTRYKARYYEAILASIYPEENIDLKHIMTGVTTWTGDWYHDLGFIATRSAR